MVRRGVNATFVQARTSDSVCTSVHAGSTGCDGEVKRLDCARERLVLMWAYVHAGSVCAMCIENAFLWRRACLVAFVRPFTPVRYGAMGM